VTCPERDYSVIKWAWRKTHLHALLRKVISSSNRLKGNKLVKHFVSLHQHPCLSLTGTKLDELHLIWIHLWQRSQTNFLEWRENFTLQIAHDLLEVTRFVAICKICEDSVLRTNIQLILLIYADRSQKAHRANKRFLDNVSSYVVDTSWTPLIKA